jgi:hypothetical protein
VIIAVNGCVRRLPRTFPIDMPENSGNMIHGNAPFEMFSDAVFAHDNAWRMTGASSFSDFINQHCTHLVFTFANTLRVNADNGPQFARLLHFLKTVDKPVVSFGLGVQSESDDLSDATFPPEVIECMQYLAGMSPMVGVRGERTKQVLADLCDVHNVKVVGCPSMFSRPGPLAQVREGLKDQSGRPVFNGTKYHVPNERALLHEAIRSRAFLVEPVSARNHAYHLGVARGDAEPELPYFLKSYKPASRGTKADDDLRDYFMSMYRLFRDTDAWYAFNAEAVSYSYGTRFHANMAAVLSGKPALWITHDARTRELTDFLHLPSISMDQAEGLTPGDVPALLQYDDFFDHIGGLFDNFNDYLEINGLPRTAKIAL